MAKLVNFLLGVVTGALVSGVVVTMFAPSSGIELQDQIKEYVHNMQGEVESAREMRRREMEEQLAKLRKS